MKKVYENEIEHYQNNQDYVAVVQKWNPGNMYGLLKDIPNLH
jgi:hypothetical protein